MNMDKNSDVALLSSREIISNKPPNATSICPNNYSKYPLFVLLTSTLIKLMINALLRAQLLGEFLINNSANKREIDF